MILSEEPLTIEDLNRIIKNHKLWLTTANRQKRLGTKACFKNFNLSDCVFKDIDFTGVSFANCRLLGSVFNNVNLSRSDLENTDLSYAEFTNVDLSQAKLQNAIIKDVAFERVDMSYTDCTNSIVINSNFEFVDFEDITPQMRLLITVLLKIVMVGSKL